MRQKLHAKVQETSHISEAGDNVKQASYPAQAKRAYLTVCLVVCWMNWVRFNPIFGMETIRQVFGCILFLGTEPNCFSVWLKD